MNSRPSEAAGLLMRRERISSLAIAQENAYHEARVLLLIDAFTGRTRGLGDVQRLLTLDYVLRFPWVLPDLPLRRQIDWPDQLAPSLQEIQALDTRYAAARYGPWYDRYERMIASLRGKTLVSVPSTPNGELRTTGTGRRAAERLAAYQSWSRHRRRAAFLHSRLNVSAQVLDRAIREALSTLGKETDGDAALDLAEGSDGERVPRL